MARKISTGWVSRYKVLFKQKGVGSSIVARSKVDLGQPKCVIVVIFLRTLVLENEMQSGILGGLTCHCQKLITDENGRIILCLVERILPPFSQKLLHCGGRFGGVADGKLQEL